MRRFSFYVLILLGMVLAGCNYLLNSKSPREEYLDGLEKAGLLNTELGKQWLTASEEAIKNPVTVKLPYAEKGYFSPNKPEAAGLKIKVQKGEKLKLSLADEDTSGTIFVELYTAEDTKHPESYIVDSDSIMSYKPEEDQEVLVLIQPELLKKGWYSLVIEKSPILNFPVKGKDGKAIGSFWHDSRDGGKRYHEGVDIFAKKGTPVVAADDGFVYRVTNYGLGGKVVWERTKDFSLYYAHLDSQYVKPGRFVQAGDTLGIVGNTGNARFTPSHLHFGIYTSSGAIDPYPFVYNYYKRPEEVKVNPKLFGMSGVIKSKSPLYAEPEKSNEVTVLNKEEEFTIMGGSGKYYKVVTDNKNSGFLSEAEVQKSLIIPGTDY